MQKQKQRQKSNQNSNGAALSFQRCQGVLERSRCPRSDDRPLRHRRQRLTFHDTVSQQQQSCNSQAKSDNSTLLKQKPPLLT